MIGAREQFETTPSEDLASNEYAGRRLSHAAVLAPHEDRQQIVSKSEAIGRKRLSRHSNPDELDCADCPFITKQLNNGIETWNGWRDISVARRKYYNGCFSSF